MAAAAEWLGVSPDHRFGVAALPYGSFCAENHAEEYRIGVAIGDHVLDLTTASERLMPGRAHLFRSGCLDEFLAAGFTAWSNVRTELTAWLSEDRYQPALADLLVPADAVSLRLPFTVGDYADFYASEHHASNIGRIFRPDAAPLTPNWKHLPIGYHGRGGTVVASGTQIRRPCGMSLPPGAAVPSFGPCARLDFEAELGFVIGTPTHLGDPVPTARFAEHVFGVCLVNDWSARDIQAFEYVPLGPFLSKSFGTSVSPWILPLAALEDARVSPPSRQDPHAGYLTESTDWGFDIEVEVRLNGHLIATLPYAAMYWSPAQMLAHLTVNGASLRSGDLYASGTISGPEPGQRGCLIELAWNGEQPITLPDGSTRSWLLDNDEVTISATAAGPDGSRLGLGSVIGSILPAVLEPAESTS